MELAEAEMKKYGIPFERYEATRNENGVIGLLQTMKRLFCECVENGYSRVLVFEDDVFFFDESVNDTMSKAMQQVPPDFLYLFLGCNFIVQPTRVTENILKVNGAYSTHAVLYTLECIRMILPLLDQVLAYDIVLMQNIQGMGRTYCAYPMLASQRIGFCLNRASVFHNSKT